MKIFRIACTWMESGTYEVNAETLEEAIKIIDDGEIFDELPRNSEYIDDSFRIDMDQTKELNEESA